MWYINYYNKMASKTGPFNQKVVSLGGGTGHFIWLKGAVRHNNPALNTAITSTWDSGGSSGELRVKEGILPPGDYMQCILGMIEDEDQLREAILILKDRSEGHPLVNQLAAKAEKSHHGVEGGIDGLRKLFRVQGNIIPASLTDVDLNSETKNGYCLNREHLLDKLDHDPNFSLEDEVSRIFLEPTPKANPKVIKAILSADKIVCPPGSPFTSIFPHLLVDGVPQAIRKAKGKLVVILNLMTTRGEDHHLVTASRWLSVFQYYLGDKEYIKKTGKSRVDYLVVNENHIDPDVITFYQNQGQKLLEVDETECKKQAPGIKIVSSNLTEYDRYAHLLRHNPEKLAQAVLSLS